MTGKRLVEVAVGEHGELVPLGIMNLDQALALPENIEAKFSHPDHAPGTTDLFVDRRELASKVRHRS